MYEAAITGNDPKESVATGRFLASESRVRQMTFALQGTMNELFVGWMDAVKAFATIAAQ